MTLTVDIIDETGTLTKEQINGINDVAHLTAKFEQINEEAELSIVFVDNETIHEINKTYRDKDQPTDVISFALEEESEDEVHIVGEGLPRVLGDIIVSVPKAHEQAETHEHSFLRELGFLVVHGFLHLLGYDHETKEEETVMFARQEEILSEYGLKRS